MDVIQYLISEQGCDPALPDNVGDMPIHIACLGGHLNVVKYLINEQRCGLACYQTVRERSGTHSIMVRGIWNYGSSI